MSAELFRTVIPVPASENKVTYSRSCILIGSCFTENMGNLLTQHKLPVVVNPSGITYNPKSVKTNLERILKGHEYSIDDLSCNNQLYFSFDHHSQFSNICPHECLNRINTSFRKAQEELKSCSHLFITFGTAYYYRLKSTNQVVSNCHKLPDKDFNRSMLDVQEIVADYSKLIPELLRYNQELQIVFTVSPIRHWKDGAHENQLSKSVLLLAIHQLQQTFAKIDYFPAYELMLDELRDYRFYEEDMLHPNKTAIEFIWKRFYSCFMDKTTQSTMQEIKNIYLARHHKPFNSNTEAYRSFAEQQIKKMHSLKKSYGNSIDFTEELDYFSQFVRK